MANPSYVKTLLAGVPANIRGAIETVFDYVLGNLRLGRCVAGTRTENLQLYALEGTTHATPNTEFSLSHGLSTSPYLLLQAVGLDTVNQQIVPLKVTRVADSQRIYLSSSVASAPIKVLVEG